MKNTVIALISFVFLVAFMPQDSTSIRAFKKNYAFLYDGLYMGKYEVSNSEYRIFLEAQKAVLSAPEYDLLQVDQKSFTSLNPKFEVYGKLYFTNTAYDNYPVVGISYVAANAYCNWLTSENAIEKVKGKHIKFSLPSKEAWQYAGNSGNSEKQFSWGTGFTKNNRGAFLANFKGSRMIEKLSKGDTTNLSNRTHFTSPVNSFFPSTAGAYNLCGNVAEMLDIKGIAAGGGFISEPFEITLQSFRNYQSSSADLGFRVMATLY